MVFYRIFIALAYILILAWRSIPVGRLGWDAVTGRERLFAPPVRPGTAPALWIHGASNGELAAARPVIERLARGLTGADLVITTNSRTARAMVQGWALPRTLVWLAPLDQRGLVRAFLDRQRPRALIMIENELWPNRLIECARRGIPVLILGGRMSEKSFRLWQHLPGLARQLTATIRWLAPQDDLSRDRFVTLGVGPAHLGPVMTLKTAPSTGLPPAPTAGCSQTLLAASTHPGEEIALLDALAAATRSRRCSQPATCPSPPARAGRSPTPARTSIWPTRWARWTAGIGRRGFASSADRWPRAAATRRSNPPPPVRSSCTAPIWKISPPPIGRSPRPVRPSPSPTRPAWRARSIR